MATPTDYFVDPSLGSDTGDGTIGTPWGRAAGDVIQWALDVGITRDATNGDRINVKSGSDDTGSATLDLTTYGVPALAQPLIIQGYAIAQGDGGIGGITGNGTTAIFNDAASDNVHFMDMHLHSCGANSVIRLDNDCAFINCEIDNITGGTALVHLDQRATLFGCYLHNSAVRGLDCEGNSYVGHCVFSNGANKFTGALHQTLAGITVFEHNIFNLDGASDGIGFQNYTIIRYNTFYATGGTGQGITAFAAGTVRAIHSNYFEGFSGVGGVGLQVPSTSKVHLYGFNKFYNNTTASDLSGDIFHNIGPDETLDASALTAPGNNNFSVTTALKGLGYPTAYQTNFNNGHRQYLDIGAVQREDPVTYIKLVNGGLAS
jgi:hypothetical protein